MLGDDGTNGAGRAGGCRRPRRPATRRRAGIRGWRARRWSGVPDSELVEQAKRRKLDGEAQAGDSRERRCVHEARPGWRALLRREGLYTSLFRRTGVSNAAGMARCGSLGSRAGCKPAGRKRDQEIVEPEAACWRRAEAELAKARMVIEIQGNVSALLEQMLGHRAWRERKLRAMICQTIDELDVDHRGPGRHAGRAALHRPRSTVTAGRPGLGRNGPRPEPDRRRPRNSSLAGLIEAGQAPVRGPGAGAPVTALAAGGDHPARRDCYRRWLLGFSVPSGRFRTMPVWVRTSWCVIGARRSCCRRR